MVRNYLLRLSSHEPACLHTSLHILSKPGGPGVPLAVNRYTLLVMGNSFAVRETNIGGKKFTMRIRRAVPQIHVIERTSHHEGDEHVRGTRPAAAESPPYEVRTRKNRRPGRVPRSPFIHISASKLGSGFRHSPSSAHATSGSDKCLNPSRNTLLSFHQ
jgi:hypothetical protein